MKTIQEHTQWARDILAAQNLPDANLSAHALLAHLCTCTKEDLIRNSNFDVAKSVSEKFRLLVQLRSRDIPLSYLTQEKEFYGLDFFVDENVLIPRPETELIIEAFSKSYKNEEISVCDMGTGSGILAITLKKLFPRLQVTAVDVSLPALHIAAKNAKRHGVDIKLVQSNLFQNIGDLFDVVVSNLPYVPTETIPTLSRSVQCEPQLALDGGNDGLALYKTLIEQFEIRLRFGGRVFLEFGEGQTLGMTKLLQDQFFTRIQVIRDYAGLDRMISAQKALAKDVARQD